MSYTTILGVTESGEIEGFEELKNSHGSAPFIWRAIFERRGVKSYGSPSTDWANTDPGRPTQGYMEPGSGLISSGYLPQCSEPEAWALALTFDGVLVRREDAPTVTRWLRSFLENIPPWMTTGTAYHWDRILELLEEMPSQYRAIGFNQTSCGDSELYVGVYEYSDEDEDDDVEPRPYNVNTDKSHFFLCQGQMDAWRAEKTEAAE